MTNNEKMSLNLLPSQAKFRADKIRLQKKTRQWMGIVLIIWTIGFGGILLAEVVLGWQLKDQLSKKAMATAGVNAMSEQVLVNQNLKYKSKLVGKVLSQRFEYGKAFEVVNNLFPEGISITNFEMEPNGKFVVSAVTDGKKNVDELEEMMLVINEGGNPQFSRIVLNGLSVKNGIWSIEVEVALK